MEYEEDVKHECSKYGHVLHIHLDPESMGHIHLKFDTIGSCEKAIQVLNGRWFGGRQLAAYFVPEGIYHANFPKAV